MKRVFNFVGALVILTAVPVSMQAAPFDDWKAAHFTPSELSNAAISGPTADPDHDGMPNLLEYALATDPKVNTLPSALPTGSIQGGYLILKVSQDSSLTDIDYVVEISSDLVNWNSGSNYVTAIDSVNQQGTRDLVTYQSLAPVSGGSKQFMRLRIKSWDALPDAWQLQYFGGIVDDPNALAPNGSGLTIAQCYFQGIDPIHSAAYLMTLTATPNSVTAPATVTLSTVIGNTTTTITRVDFYEDNTYVGSATSAPFQWSLSSRPAGNYVFKAVSFDSAGLSQTATVSLQIVPSTASATSTSYYRYTGSSWDYTTTILAVDMEKGVLLDANGNNAAKFPNGLPWFTRIQSSAVYHLSNQTGSVGYTTSFSNPIVAFGSAGGGSNLYVGQNYSFAIACGGLNQTAATVDDVKVDIYLKSDFASGATNVAPRDTKYIKIPKTSDATSWGTFTQNGYVQETTWNYALAGSTVDFTVQVQYIWGGGSYILLQRGQWPLLVAHRSGNADFVYKVSFKGYTTDSTTSYWMAATNPSSPSTTHDYDATYTLDFDPVPTGMVGYLLQPHFQGIPLPSAYQGKSLEELIHNSLPVTTNISTPNATTISALTTVDNSPELRSHPVLDKLVADLGNDPMALANYVLNEIELTDSMGYNTSGLAASQNSINPPGVNRGALATYLEGQGNPTEQCALLIYMLRKINVPCGYVFPQQQNNLLMFDQQLSKLLRTQLRGETYNAPPTLIPVNYPWVAAYIDGQWINIFPWLKDTAVEEGVDLWDYMPTGYKSAAQLTRNYILNESRIRPLNGEKDNLGILLPLFIKQQVLTAHPELTYDQIGVNIYNRRNNFTKWSDFPRPWQTPTVGDTDLLANISGISNIFDTLSIEIISARTGGNVSLFKTPDLRMVDLQNRRLLTYCKKTGTNTHNLYLSLEASRPGTTGSGTFAAGSDLIDKQLWSYGLTSIDNSLLIKHVFKRQNGYTPSQYAFLGYSAVTTDARQYTIAKGTMDAICLHSGRVSQRMLDFQAEKYWAFQQAQRLNPTPGNVDPELADGQPLYLMGLSYFYKSSQFRQLLEGLFKIHFITSIGDGSAKLDPKRDSSSNLPNNGDVILSYPVIDVHEDFPIGYVGSTSTHVNSNNDLSVVKDMFTSFYSAGASAYEHITVNQFFGQTSGFSTMRLLDVAQGSTPGSNILQLTSANYSAAGATNYTFNGTTRTLAAWTGTNVWGYVTAALNKTNGDSANAVVYMTPGPIQPAGNVVYGVGAFIMDINSFGGSWIVTYQPTSGGQGSSIAVPMSTDPAAIAPATVVSSLILPSADGSYNFNNTSSYTSSSQFTVAVDFSLDNASAIYNGLSNNNFTLDPATSLQYTSGAFLIDPSVTTTAGQFKLTLNEGFTGGPVINSNLLASQGNLMDAKISFTLTVPNDAADPVNVVTGEFYIDAIDIKLPGPMPLVIRRNYGSQNLADNNFGNGWKMSYFPYLVVSTDSTLIYAAEMDGSVIAYRRQTSPTTRWVPAAADNPQMANATQHGAGGTANLFNNRIDSTDSLTYTLTGADGSTRTFLVQSYPTGSSPSDLTRQRPYLQKWTDSRGNYYDFVFGQAPTAVDYGQLTKIKSSNGNFIGLIYDTYGHISEAYTGDGRRLSYDYDAYGDLVKVTLPDASTLKYDYKHSMTTDSTPVVYSEHLIIRETLPNSRVIENDYDANRRVKVQRSTVGVNSTLTVSGTFTYSSTTNADGTVTGNTLLADALGKVTRYDFQNSQITGITDPLGQQTTQVWFQSTDSALPGYYPRSLRYSINQRGLRTDYQYDSKGNLVQSVVTGNLTGSGSTAETATSTMSYSALNMVTTITDALNNSTVYTYGDSSRPYDPTSMEKRTATGSVAITQMVYENVTGSNIGAYGVLKTQTVSSGTTDQAVTSFTNDTHGFLTSLTQYSGTADPNIVTTFSYNLRGERTSATDSANRTTKYSYDGRGNLTGTERYDEYGGLMAWQYSYYNQNGELEWSQGPRYSPNDYILKQYDGAGRLTQIVKWRSQAATNGSGVVAGSGDGAYSTTTNTYNAMGYLTKVVDPNQKSTVMTYDDTGRVLTRFAYDDNSGATALASETYNYSTALAPLTATYTTPLGGVEVRQFTSTGQLQKVTSPDGTTKQYRYDRAGRVVTEILTNSSYWTTVYDDFSRTITRTLRDSGGTVLATESKSLDRRGNVVRSVDTENNVFKTTYDALNRVKSSTGPSTSGNSAQKNVSYKYDAAGKMTTVTNGLGEQNVTYYDALQRPTFVFVRNRDGSTADLTSYWYASDFNSVMVTKGSGTNKVSTTEYTNTFGQPVLLKNSDGTFQLTQYDANGNRVAFTDEQGVTTTWTYDGLNRPTKQVLPASTASNSAIIQFTYQNGNKLLKRIMPGGLTSVTTLDTAGRKSQEQLLDASNNTTRTFTYSYYASGNYQGLLQSMGDPRGFVITTSYDAFIRPVSLSSTGSGIAEQNQTTSYVYDKRNLVKQVTQTYPTGTVIVDRGFDGYGQLANETVTLNGTAVSKWNQSWNSAGRRSALNWKLSTATGSQYLYDYNANGQLTSVTNSGTAYSYTYGDSGLLQSRTAPDHSMVIASRDTRGRVLTQNTTVSSTLPLAETLTWRNDSRINTYTAARGSLAAIPNETRTYGYDARGRLLSEPYRWNGQGQTTTYQFDNNTESGAGLRTLAQTDTTTQTSYQGTTTLSNFLRPTTETWKPGDGSTNTVGWGYDSMGCATTRTVSTGITQTLTWDSFGRLVKILQRDGSNNGFDWKAVYDGLGRRIQTTQQPITGGANSGTLLTIASTYDPMVEFLELGVAVNGVKTWKVYGAGANGSYGSLQGLSALEALVTESSGVRVGVLNDFFGNTVATVSGGTVTWAPNAVGGYGVLPGSSATALDATHTLAQAILWRGRYMDATGFYYIGARHYDATSGRFLSPDPLGHGSSMTLYDFANGDPVNQFDPTGRTGLKFQSEKSSGLASWNPTGMDPKIALMMDQSFNNNKSSNVGLSYLKEYNQNTWLGAHWLAASVGDDLSGGTWSMPADDAHVTASQMYYQSVTGTGPNSRIFTENSVMGSQILQTEYVQRSMQEAVLQALDGNFSSVDSVRSLRNENPLIYPLDFILDASGQNPARAYQGSIAGTVTPSAPFYRDGAIYIPMTVILRDTMNAVSATHNPPPIGYTGSEWNAGFTQSNPFGPNGPLRTIQVEYNLNITVTLPAPPSR